MTSEPAFFVGLLLGFTGLACVGVGAFLGRRYELIVAGGIPFVVSGVLLVHIASERHRFRVTEVVINPIGDYSGRCPAQPRLRVRVTTAGGDGEVTFRVWLDEGSDLPPRSVRVQPNVSFEYVTRITAAKTGSLTAYAAVDSPNHKVASRVFQVTCAGA